MKYISKSRTVLNLISVVPGAQDERVDVRSVLIEPLLFERRGFKQPHSSVSRRPLFP